MKLNLQTQVHGGPWTPKVIELPWLWTNFWVLSNFDSSHSRELCLLILDSIITGDEPSSMKLMFNIFRCKMIFRKCFCIFDCLVWIKIIVNEKYVQFDQQSLFNFFKMASIFENSKLFFKFEHLVLKSIEPTRTSPGPNRDIAMTVETPTGLDRDLADTRPRPCWDLTRITSGLEWDCAATPPRYDRDLIGT